ncbi:hypothetical protein LOC68_00850 [Blastopirellula sp. JC732]|uniref:Uncharacterized protein n=1 Tax=Blastopirellula sediminis TaxID=2894196 RepID=A0A9X1MH18_9BACT|nr:hypothetical protein [Blastopirellula sediminis]MCC9604423.1 hypothetical protein [Blastopirellula sediminis]MCC9626943.1 hypothetical protein [Blastopirellula sediminis]
MPAPSSFPSDDLQLRPDEPTAANAFASPPLRPHASSRRLTRTLLMVGGGLLGLVVLLGGMAIAGKYAWDLASKSNPIPPANPWTVPVENGGPAPNVPPPNVPQNVNQIGPSSVMSDPNMGQMFRPPNYPIEVRFPSGPVVQEQIAGLEQFRWAISPQYKNSEVGSITEVKLIVLPREPNQNDLDAIEAAKRRVSPLPPDESLIRNARLGSASLVGRPAYMVSFEMPSQRTLNFAAYIPHRQQVYVLLAVAEANCLPNRWMDIVHSIRFNDLVASSPPPRVEPTEVPAAPQPESTMPAQPTSSAPASGLSGLLGGLDVSGLWGGAVKMRSKLHPFEVEFPTSDVIAFPKNQLNPSATQPVNYLHRLDAGMVHGEHILHTDLTRGYGTVFSVTYAPLAAGISADEMMKTLMDGFALAGKSPGVNLDVNTISVDGVTALDITQTTGTSIPGIGLTERVRIFFHPTGVYSVAARSKEGRAVEDRFINSFHFLSAPGTPGDGSKLIPVLNPKGPRPTPRNISGQPDPNGQYVRWEEIPVE